MICRKTSRRNLSDRFFRRQWKGNYDGLTSAAETPGSGKLALILALAIMVGAEIRKVLWLPRVGRKVANCFTPCQRA